jgi:PAS domain S-box-containing protein
MLMLYKRAGVVAGFLLLLVVLITDFAVIRRQLAVQIATQDLVTHTHQILLQLRQVESLLENSESGQRGYLYTGDPRYLAPYNFAASQIQPHIEMLRQLTADNPGDQQHVRELRALAEAKLQEITQTIALYRAGETEQARQLVLSDAGLNTMTALHQLMTQMEQEQSVLRMQQADAVNRSIRTTVACIYLSGTLAACGLILLAYYILQEMGLRERHAHEMSAREEWFRVTLSSIGEAVIATDPKGNVTFLNPPAIHLTGTSLLTAIGKPIADIVPIFNEYTQKPVENPVHKVMETGQVVGLANHTVLRRPDGSLLPIEDSAAPIRDDRGELVGVVLVFRDATEERRSQEVLRRTEKLAAAARLSATMAHEINNPLEAVGNLIYLAKGAPGTSAEVDHQLTLAEHELARVAHLTRQTLGFYRESNVPDEIEMATVIESVLTLYGNKLKAKNISVRREFGVCPPIRGLIGELNQAVSNLIANAADAVDPYGVIRIGLLCLERPEGNLVQLTIEDNGPGISAEHAELIFEPFFTTKKDVGTGLGLWVTREIVDRHGGTIEVKSRQTNGERGASFSILLPAVNPSESPESSRGSLNGS